MSGNLTGLTALMRGPISSVGSLATARGASAYAHSQANRSLDSLSQILDLPKDVVDRRRKANDTILQLHDAQRSMVSDRKAAAKQRLDMAGAKLQMLRMFAGDPKAMAQQAKQIAREIQQAAREYGAALKVEGGAAATGAIAGPPAQANGDQAGAAAEASPGEGGLAGGTEAGAGERVDPAETAAAADDAPDAKAGEPATRSANPAKTDQEKAAEAYQAAAADLSSRHSKAQGEREAIDAFKQAAREAKRLIEEAARRMKAEEGGDGEVRQLDASARAMTRAVDDLDRAAAETGQVGPAGQAGLGAANGLAVATASIAAAPIAVAVDILA
jgi:hypothetical protein